MANNLNFNDQQNVKAALLEYEKDVKINGKFKIGTKKDEYIGNVAHIYDNVNDNEEQVFVLTNNGQGAQQNAVPYTASDEALSLIHISLCDPRRKRIGSRQSGCSRKKY